MFEISTMSTMSTMSTIPTTRPVDVSISVDSVPHAEAPMYPPARPTAQGLLHRCRAGAVRALVVALTAAAALLFARPGPARAATVRQIAVPAVPMGWASWNSFAAKIDYNVIKQQADAFVAAGLPAAGYRYINIDEGWWQGTRDSAGDITVDTGEWPGGMSAVADHIHGKGLKAGIYTDAGKGPVRHRQPGRGPAEPHLRRAEHHRPLVRPRPDRRLGDGARPVGALHPRLVRDELHRRRPRGRHGHAQGQRHRGGEQ
jgi:hypothetical protein